ncbi:MAG: dialkylresorcinol condensing enzyme [Epsilonproteobacteria bacterium (ex Lamellibrachia satsuma)]|nr:MAG: dialkylresorcinol condensing enzyme [Epsilonproteobacteria bacterium (ex Lamellibrachia satsuma)]
MKKVLVLYYSQSGQLKGVVDSFISKLYDEEIEVDIKQIEPLRPYPYPWNFYEFADEFPEAVHMDGCEVKELEDLADSYDLIILGYTIWFLSPSTPIVGFLKSDQAKKIFKDKPVVTLIACRDMWVLAQEKMKALLGNLGAKLIDNVALTDQGKGIYSFVTTPRWLLTGKKDAFWFFPPAGISQRDIDEASRFGERLKIALKDNKEKEGKPILQNLGAVNVDGKLIASEIIATRSSKIWGKIIKLFGKKRSFGRRVGLTLYSIFLVLLVFTIVPLNIMVRKLLNIFQKEKLRSLEIKYEKPSGR